MCGNQNKVYTIWQIAAKKGLECVPLLFHIFMFVLHFLPVCERIDFIVATLTCHLVAVCEEEEAPPREPIEVTSEHGRHER